MINGLIIFLLEDLVIYEGKKLQVTPVVVIKDLEQNS